MSSSSRRTFIGSTLSLAGASTLAPTFMSLATTASAADVDYAADSSAAAPYRGVRIIDTDAMPWPAPMNALGWRVKTLFDNEDTGDHLIIIHVPIGSEGGANHYHDFHEWAYWLTGDFVNNEYTHPDQRMGSFQQFREGIFLDRPAYSLHGGEPERLDSQVGGTCLIMEEGGKSFSVIPGEPRYSEAYKQVQQWTVPRIIDTLQDIPWEPADGVDGVFVKHLVEDQVRGFRATMWRLSAGWDSAQAPEFARAYYYRQAHQFNFVIAGDMRITGYREPGKPAQTFTLGPNYYFERPPMSMFGLADGQVSESGAVWIEVTYGTGTAINNVPTEAPNFT